jgi:hypothetical protein
MANADKTLKNKDQLDIYPITRERNVYDENNVNLKTKFENVVFNDNTVHKFSQELYEESKNILPLVNSSAKAESGARYINCEYSESTGQTKFTTSGSGEEFTFNLIGKVTYTGQKYPSAVTLTTDNSILLKAGTYTVTSKKTGQGTVVPYACVGNLGSDFTRTQVANLSYTFTITEDKYFSVLCYCLMANSTDVTYVELQLEEESVATEIAKYNPNRHITNREAEFLKEKFGKQVNILDFTKVEKIGGSLTYGISGSSLILTSTSTSGTGYCCIPYNFEKGKDYTINYNVSGGYNNAIIFTKDLRTVIKEIKVTNEPVSFIYDNDITDVYIVLYCGYGNVTTYSDIILVYGSYTKDTMPSYQPYNSSSHITNAQADLLKSEWEKQENILNLTNSTLTYTANDTYKAYSIPVPNLKDNTTYRLSSFGNFKTGLWLKDSNNTMLFNTLLSETFTTTDASLIKSCEIVIEGLVVGTTYTFNEETLKTMLTEGLNKPEKFKKWNGEIIHEKDVLKLKYSHSINLTTDNFRIWLNVMCERSTPFTIVELSKWLYENSYNATGFADSAWLTVSGGNRNNNNQVIAISSFNNNGSNVFGYLYGSSAGTEFGSITITNITDYVRKII